MGEKDKIEKLLEDYPDVFADIINVLVYQGEEVVKPEDATTCNCIRWSKLSFSDVKERCKRIL